MKVSPSSTNQGAFPRVYSPTHVSTGPAPGQSAPKTVPLIPPAASIQPQNRTAYPMVHLAPQGRAAMQRSLNIGTIQRVRIQYIQKDIDEIEDRHKKSFRKAMEELEGGEFGRWNLITETPHVRTTDITGDGGRGDLRLHATQLDDGGFQIQLNRHGGAGKHGGHHVAISTSAGTYQEKDSAVLAQEVHPKATPAPAPAKLSPSTTTASPPTAPVPPSSSGVSDFDLSDDLFTTKAPTDLDERKKALGKKRGKGK